MRPMPKQNITLSLEKDLLRKVRLLSSRKSISVSKLLSNELERLVAESERYAQAKRSALSALKKGFHMGGTITATRDELHDRKGLR
jgi:hypothetical protein